MNIIRVTVDRKEQGARVVDEFGAHWGWSLGENSF